MIIILIILLVFFGVILFILYKCLTHQYLDKKTKSNNTTKPQESEAEILIGNGTTSASPPDSKPRLKKVGLERGLSAMTGKVIADLNNDRETRKNSTDVEKCASSKVAVDQSVSKLSEKRATRGEKTTRIPKATNAKTSSDE